MDPNNMRKVRQLMQPGGIAEAMMQDKYEGPTGHTYSEAALVADVINVMRLNTKQLGAIHDVDVEIKRMTEERAAQLLEQMARDNDLALVQVFEALEDKQDAIIEAVMGADDYEQFLQTKERAAMSVPDEQVGNRDDAEPAPADDADSTPPAHNTDLNVDATTAEETPDVEADGGDAEADEEVDE